ncbi:enoyl-CoA hydratase/isomerase family protein [Acanthopleuribacter pedis]|uniref:Enoyl-CoA hydratase/isomerase family protein n=1 Tax=Acanthopleuribacter pedis TaxID=442870 RepID=A0A8J7U3P5_9BACT|nr:enoyl-CoA hydratase/isomerase family protein [Acanthopleuribacter pedis]MBO1320643.1 enoyl-CoA hydratase/isomerase family protein [Acanthopleuribacter pedis]
MSVILTHEGPVSVITMDLPPMNLLNIEVIDQLIQCHEEADHHPETRVIITRSAVTEMFSNGLNPMYVLKRDEAGRADVFRAIGRLLNRLFKLGKPHIAALNGPAMAGGAVLALTADFRYMEQEHGRLCFSEPKVGLPIPEPISAIIASFCTPSMVREVVLYGKNMDAQTALASGLVDAVAPGEEGLQELIEQGVGRLARLSPAVLRATKIGMRRRLYKLTETFENDLGDFAQFTHADFLGEGLQALVEQRHPVFKR